MKKNSQIHIWMETELKNRLQREAIESNISLCEFCRQKLIENSSLVRIELKLDELIKKNSILGYRGIYKASGLASSNINSR